jgi:hypothetical protein
MDFEKWWHVNKDLYGLVNVTKEVAKAIWIDAINSIQQPVTEQIKELIQTLENES